MPARDYRKIFEKTLADFRDDDNWIDPAESGALDDETIADMFFCIEESALGVHGDNPVRKLFSDAKLDAKNPFHWLDLLEGLASIFYYEKKRPGARPLRSRDYLETLGNRFDQLAANNPGLNDEEVADRLIRSFEEYGKLEANSITRMIGPLRSGGIVKTMPKRVRSRN